MFDSKQFAADLAKEYKKRYPESNKNNKLLEPFVIQITAKMIAIAIEKLEESKN